MRTLVTSFIVGGVMALGETGSPSPQVRSAFADSLFAVVITRGPAWDTLRPPGEQRGFREHSANVASLRRAGRIVMGGRFGDYGLILVRANDAAEARMLFSADSALAGGVFRADFHHAPTLVPALDARPGGGGVPPLGRSCAICGGCASRESAERGGRSRATSRG